MPPAGPEKGGASHAPGDGNKGPEGKPKSSFRNDARMKVRRLSWMCELVMRG